MSTAAYWQDWYAQNADRQKASAKSWYAANRERAQARQREYAARNPGVQMAADAVKAQKRRGIEPILRIAASVWHRISLLPCFSCGQEPAGGVDHITAFAHGGLNVIGNLQPACFPCNRRKGPRGRHV